MWSCKHVINLRAGLSWGEWFSWVGSRVEMIGEHGTTAAAQSRGRRERSGVQTSGRLPLNTHFLSGLTGRLPRDALSTEHTVQTRDQDVETSQLHLNSWLLMVDGAAYWEAPHLWCQRQREPERERERERGCLLFVDQSWIKNRLWSSLL